MNQTDKFLQEKLDSGSAEGISDTQTIDESSPQNSACATPKVKSHWLGRARRSEFIPVMIVMNFLAKFLGSGMDETAARLLGLFICAVCLIESARRLHDMGRSGWWSILFLVPLVWLWGWSKGQVGPNEYGPDPRA